MSFLPIAPRGSKYSTQTQVENIRRCQFPKMQILPTKMCLLKTSVTLTKVLLYKNCWNTNAVHLISPLCAWVHSMLLEQISWWPRKAWKSVQTRHYPEQCEGLREVWRSRIRGIRPLQNHSGGYDQTAAWRTSGTTFKVALKLLSWFKFWEAAQSK